METAVDSQGRALPRECPSELEEVVKSAYLKRQGDAALECGDVLAARQLYSEALALQEGSEEVLLSLARLQLADGEVLRPEALVERALSLRPSSTQAALLRAEVALRRDDVESALASVSELLLRDGSQWRSALHVLSQADRGEADGQAARDTVEGMLAVLESTFHPRCPSSTRRLLSLLSDVDNAPLRVSALLALGRCLSSEERWQESLGCFESAASLACSRSDGPRQLDCLLPLLSAYRHLGQGELCLLVLEQLLDVCAKWPSLAPSALLESAYAEASLLHLSVDSSGEEAVVVAEAGLRLFPASADLHAVLCRVHLHRGHLVLAEQHASLSGDSSLLGAVRVRQGKEYRGLCMLETAWKQRGTGQALSEWLDGLLCCGQGQQALHVASQLSLPVEALLAASKAALESHDDVRAEAWAQLAFDAGCAGAWLQLATVLATSNEREQLERARRLLRAHPEGTASALLSLRAELSARLLLSDECFSAVERMRGGDMTLDEFSALSLPGAVLVLHTLGQRLVAWLHTGRVSFHVFALDPVTEAELDSAWQQAEWRDSYHEEGRGVHVTASSAKTTPFDVARWRRVLLSPWQDELSRCSRVTVVGGPRRCPWLTLLPHHEVGQVPRASLLRTRTEAALSGRVLVLGNPGGVVRPLPEAQLELAHVARCLHTTALSGEEATRDAFLHALPRVDVLHVATLSSVAQDALWLHDGRVSSEDVLQTGCHARLVVLSCAHEDGAWWADAFLQAGVGVLLVLCFPVSAALLRPFLVALYAHLRRSCSVAEALRRSWQQTPFIPVQLFGRDVLSLLAVERAVAMRVVDETTAEDAAPSWTQLQSDVARMHVVGLLPLLDDVLSSSAPCRPLPAPLAQHASALRVLASTGLRLRLPDAVVALHSPRTQPVAQLVSLLVSLGAHMAALCLACMSLPHDSLRSAVSVLDLSSAHAHLALHLHDHDVQRAWQHDALRRLLRACGLLRVGLWLVRRERHVTRERLSVLMDTMRLLVADTTPALVAVGQSPLATLEDVSRVHASFLADHAQLLHRLRQACVRTPTPSATTPRVRVKMRATRMQSVWRVPVTWQPPRPSKHVAQQRSHMEGLVHDAHTSTQQRVRGDRQTLADNMLD